MVEKVKQLDYLTAKRVHYCVLNLACILNLVAGIITPVKNFKVAAFQI